MSEKTRGHVPADSVRCLSCRHVYEKPSQGGTSHRNPGCPKCGYVGWLATVRAMPGVPRLYGTTAR